MVSRQRKHELWRRQEVRASRQYIELVRHKEQLLKDIEAFKNAKRDEIKITTREIDKLKKQLKQARAKITYMNAHLGEFAPKKPYSRVNKK